MLIIKIKKLWSDFKWWVLCELDSLTIYNIEDDFYRECLGCGGKGYIPHTSSLRKKEILIVPCPYNSKKQTIYVPFWYKKVKIKYRKSFKF